MPLWLIFTPHDSSMIGFIVRDDSGVDATFKVAKVADVSDRLVVKLPEDGNNQIVQGILREKGV